MPNPTAIWDNICPTISERGKPSSFCSLFALPILGGWRNPFADQPLSINLPGAGSGQRLTKLDLFGHHVRRQLLRTVSLQLSCVNRIAVINSNNCTDGIADCLIWDRQSHRLVDSRMRDHHRFDLTKLDAVAARFDHVIFAPDQHKIPFLIECYPIARAVQFFVPAWP